MTDGDRRCERYQAPFQRRQWNHRFCTVRCRQIAKARRTIARCQARLAALGAPVSNAICKHCGKTFHSSPGLRNVCSSECFCALVSKGTGNRAHA